jgi:predicted RNA binding protein YcfA (HicA-like mRNA interferase family)
MLLNCSAVLARIKGFIIVRTKGSHHFLRHADGRITTVPTHSNEPIGTGLLLKI